ncbi:MAG: 16S rRNA (adenine(1518)-N(6)/adenine(1519)-N(6))-dimethyltransferase RsmA [Acholeplasmatales bacterium]|jgi:16S rRNA (adenine1518-N6/adenine1519-N6)-dimethyltransferase|nr:16S rRNA (adenine(1518)-N(6)/adenine(1519)-N(6))-dimethyltransferase RsmA [Acholeplasmatales bacterium]MDD7395011.1 16S rRNA (adenine(1518)-N(6)/adenine(1519)-N(6))-dimethyltransferase RsmA [Acholeplasmatales bacterium]MDY4015796.1 16S rRNA (adenine(1518)-N(6)/adenine(1519)-N(6))-dimethyltransferase RsmA [Bacilli bacterium]HCX07492.1 16S rRNA (adenine(1518)-N(6)/adenine(1519)-N(6))-dimethyltransferase [Acholeplasmatales bacterium]
MTKEQVKKILEQNDIIVKKQYGQNFLLDDNILKNIVKSAELKKDTNVIEIGPGLGFLTNYLQQATTNVLCYEIDEQMVEHLNELNYNISIINDDFLKRNLNKDFKNIFDNSNNITLVANLPYYITTPILLKVLEETTRIDKMIVMMQTEVAKRLCGKPSTKDYNALSVLIQYFTNPRIIFNVSPKSFFPEPNVESSVVMIEKKEEPLLEVKNLDFFLKFNRNIFSQRRKTLYNNIQKAYNYDKELIKKIIKENNLDESVRSEELDVSQIVKLANDFYING